MIKQMLTLALALVLVPSAMGAGLMQPKDKSLPALQIQEHHVRVVINNGFAVTEVDQVFYNPNEIDLDAIYTFPLPKNASLSELSLWIDGQEVVGEVIEKEEARRVAKEEREAGRETALAEKREYHAFDVLVSPVRAASSTRVRLLYMQPLEIDGGTGRYVYPLEEGEIDEEARAFWDRLPRVHGKFSFEATLRSSYPLEDVRVKGAAQSAVNQDAPDTWKVWIDGEEGTTSLDQDIVLYYRLATDLPARVDLLPYRAGAGPGSFLLVVTPGADLRETVEGTDWMIVLDISGSMANKIGTAADAVSRALDQLRPQDRFRVVVFSNRARELTHGWQAVDESSVEQARQALLALGSEGGTNIYAGLQAGLRLLEPDRTSALILVSDGGANEGPTEHGAFVELLGKKDVRLFTFVMGQGANRPLLERMAEASNGFAMDLSNQDDMYGRLIQAKAKLAREALHGVRVELDGVDVTDLAPHRLPSAYFGQQIVLFGRYYKPGPATLRLRARISGEERSWETRIELPERDETYPEVERLWALARTRDLQQQIDEGGDRSELRPAIVGLGTEFSIVTDHTSMIVLREERFEELGIDRRNQRRVGTERAARQARANAVTVQTRADQAKPMFGDARAHRSGGGGGGGGAGASGPAFLLLLSGLYGAREWLRRRSK